MTFEDDFPSLKDKLLINPHNISLKCDGDIVINIYDLKETCLDRHKVKEAIDNCWNRINKPNKKNEIDIPYVALQLRLLKDELGLDK